MSDTPDTETLRGLVATGTRWPARKKLELAALAPQLAQEVLDLRSERSEREAELASARGEVERLREIEGLIGLINWGAPTEHDDALITEMRALTRTE